MAATPEGRAATARFRRQQEQVAALLTRRLRTFLPLLDPATLGRTEDAFIAAATDLALAGRRMSADLVPDYLTAYRFAENVDGQRYLAALPPARIEAIETSMRVTGPVALKRALSAGMTRHAAQETAWVMARGAVVRHALDGGREVVVASTEADPLALGWARVARGTCCAFCAMLTSRGPVYRTQQSASFQAHDHCHCSPEPVYHRDGAWSDAALDMRSLWQASTKGVGYRDRLSVFRAALAEQRRAAA